MNDWWIGVSNVQCERRATKGLEDRGFEVWWPKRVVELRVGPHRREACRLYPAFPSYLFVRSPVDRSWHDMYGVDGLKSILMIDWKALRIADVVIQALKVRLALTAVPMPVIEDAFRIGDKLVITDGPFETFPAVLRRILGANVMIVEADLFGRQTPVALDRGQIARVA